MNGVDGTRKIYRCPKCRKRFSFWRPEALPGAKVKCYYCETEFDDEATRRPPAAPLPSPEPAPQVT